MCECPMLPPPCSNLSAVQPHHGSVSHDVGVVDVSCDLRGLDSQGGPIARISFARSLLLLHFGGGRGLCRSPTVDVGRSRSAITAEHCRDRWHVALTP